MNLDLKFYWKLFIRRFPVMLLFVLVFSTLGVITALKAPETWSTTARLLVEDPQIPDEMVASTVATDASEQLEIIQQKLLTRANLIDIANRFEVFENIREMEPDTVVDGMKDATTISRYAGRNQATLMTISFQARSGQIAANVVNEYVTLVLEENSEFRVSRAESTLTFFEQEVERLGEDLDRQSTQIALFKADNIEALPEDQNYRLGRQALLQERVARLERERSATVQQRDEVLRIFESTGMVGGSAQRLRTPEQEQMIVVEADLERAISLYSENHPRVIRLQARLDRLQAIVTAQLEANAGIQDLESNASPQEFMLQANIAQLDGRLQLIDADLTSTKDELGGLQEAIADSSANGIALSALERDYQNIQARYNAAVNNLNSARMSERIESTAQGQRITVIENAVVPRVPTGPDRPRTAIMGAAFGIVLAGAYFMLLELLNRAIRRPEELISRFEVTPIAVVPYMESRTQRLIRRGSIIATTVLVLLGVPLLLWYIDTQYLPLELIVEKGLDKLGLG